jgi:hypothetical protein
MLRTRWGHASLTLDDGRVLVMGGNSYEDYGDRCCALSASTNLSGEIYDPATNAWTFTSPMPVGERDRLVGLWWTGTLPNGTVLMLSGFSFELVKTYDPSRDEWETLEVSGRAQMMEGREGLNYGAIPIPLTNGDVLLAGGPDWDRNGVFATVAASVFSPATASWRATSGMQTPRHYAEAVRLRDGSVLVFGGQQRRFGRWNREYSYSVPVVTSELYNPSTGIWSPR